MTTIRAAVLLLAVAAAACSSAPSSQHLYALNALAREGAAPSAAHATIVVGPVTVPELVDRPQWVVRHDDHSVRILELHRWAEPLRDGIARTLSANLGRLLGTGRVLHWRQAAAADADIRLVVDVTTWEAKVGEGVTVEVLWTVRGRGHVGSASHRSSAIEAADGADPADLAIAFDRAVLRLAQDIAPILAAAMRSG